MCLVRCELSPGNLMSRDRIATGLRGTGRIAAGGPIRGCVTRARTGWPPPFGAGRRSDRSMGKPWGGDASGLSLPPGGQTALVGTFYGVALVDLSSGERLLISK